MSSDGPYSNAFLQAGAYRLNMLTLCTQGVTKFVIDALDEDIGKLVIGRKM